MTAPVGRQGIHRRDGIWIHRGRLHPDDRADRAGIPLTTVARTLFDLAESVDLKRLESAWEEADRLKLLRLSEVEGVCERGCGRHALRPIRRLLGEARAPVTTRSPLEDRFAEFCRRHLADLPAPLTNVSILDHEVDVYWPPSASRSRWTAGNTTITALPSSAIESGVHGVLDRRIQGVSLTQRRPVFRTAWSARDEYREAKNPARQ